MELCVAAAESAARIATSVQPDEWKKARDNFFMLHWGPLAIVEDVESTEKQVTTAMFYFKQSFDEMMREKLKVGLDVDLSNRVPDLPLHGLEYQAIKISKACQAYLTSKWDAGILGWARWPFRSTPAQGQR